MAGSTKAFGAASGSSFAAVSCSRICAQTSSTISALVQRLAGLPWTIPGASQLDTSTDKQSAYVPSP